MTNTTKLLLAGLLLSITQVHPTEPVVETKADTNTVVTVEKPQTQLNIETKIPKLDKKAGKSSCCKSLCCFIADSCVTMAVMTAGSMYAMYQVLVPIEEWLTTTDFKESGSRVGKFLVKSKPILCNDLSEADLVESPDFLESKFHKFLSGLNATICLTQELDIQEPLANIVILETW